MGLAARLAHKVKCHTIGTMVGRPWNNWFHCNGNTYGTWPPGDSRGFRTRHHREHVEGDYKNRPAAGKYDQRLARAKTLMPREAVRLSWPCRVAACNEMARSLKRHKIEVVAVAINEIHFHLLARFPDGNPRKWGGIAKKNASRALSDEGLIEPGGVWAKRFRCWPIRDRVHQVNAVWYIIDHYQEGAAIWVLPNLLARVDRRRRNSR